MFRQISGGKPVEGTLYYHYARLIEDLYAVERAQQLLRGPGDPLQGHPHRRPRSPTAKASA